MIIDETQEPLLAAGFRPPSEDWFVKYDPKGKEYGYFAARILDDGRVKVLKRSDQDQVDVAHTAGIPHVEFEINPVIYRMEFPNVKEFQAWARECT